jgi:hypothetical protein
VLFLPACVLWFTRGSLDLLANIFGSIFWVFAAAFVWVSFSSAMSYRCLSPMLQGSAIGWVHNTRARKSCRATPSDSRYIGRFSWCSRQILTLIQLHVLYISRILRMDGARALRSNVNPRHHMDSRFTNWKGESEQLQLLPTTDQN